MTVAVTLYTTATLLSGGLLGVGVGYLLTLVGAAAGQHRPRTGAKSVSHSWRTTILVPAHDEEPVIADTLRSLTAQHYSADHFRIVVIADNCSDRTAEIARAQGATVWERTDTTNRGKGYALAWATERLLSEQAPSDAFVIVDADTVADPDFLQCLIEQLQVRQDASGYAALQGRYGVLNPEGGWRAALMAGAFDLVNHIRPLGADRLGWSVDLKGNGMGFTQAVLRVAPWSGHSITEDLDYGLDLLQHHGIAVGYVPEARVRAQMPTSGKQAASQRDRWEMGRRLLVRQRALPLLASGLRHRDGRLIEAGFRLLLPPFAELSAFCLAWLACVCIGAILHLLPAPPTVWYALACLPFTGMLIYLLAGLRLAGASGSAYRALLYAPFYAAWKFARILLRPRSPRGGAPLDWIRTGRNLPEETMPRS